MITIPCSPKRNQVAAQAAARSAAAPPRRSAAVHVFCGFVFAMTIGALGTNPTPGDVFDDPSMVVYYDYVENGALQGGRLVFDLQDPVVRSSFGLDDDQRGQPGLRWASTTIVNSGPSTNRVDIVLLGDGYTAGQLNTYATHVNNVVNSFFAQEPLNAYLPFFNVHRVDVISNESGVDEPNNGIFRDTALDMAYDCNGIDRLLCINLSKAFTAAGSAPARDQILALANSSRYGGAGYPSSNLCTVAGANSSALEIALHEFGHAFADLADEYDYGGPSVYSGGEPSAVNVSIYQAAQMESLQTKWYRWLDLPNVDTFEGANYSQFGIYRPTNNSKMRNLGRPFEQVNVEQFVISAYKTVRPIDDATPASGQPYPYGTSFFVTPVQPADHSLDVQWSVDSVDVSGANLTTFTPDYAGLPPGVHDVGVTVVDNTPRVRNENARAQWLTAQRFWQISIEDCNMNGIPDDIDIAGGTSADCDADGVPDECQLDCNANGVADACDVATGQSSDCDANGVPDECQPDCNQNGVADACDIASGGSGDCNHNGMPDECEGLPVEVQWVHCVAAHKVGGGALQELYVDVDLSNDPARRTTEPRTSGLQIIDVQFSRAVQSATVTIHRPVGAPVMTPMTLTAGAHGPASLGRMDLLTPLPNDNVYTLRIAATAVAGCSITRDVCMASLIGDFDGDGQVTAADKAGLVGFVFQPVSQATVRYDIQPLGGDSGLIDAFDVAAWAGFFGTNVTGDPCPAAP